MKVVKVFWSDAQDHPDKWVNAAAAAAFGQVTCIIESVGFLVSDTEKYVTLAGDFDISDDNYGRVTKIPKGWVTRVEDI